MEWKCFLILFLTGLGMINSSGFSLVSEIGGPVEAGVQGLLLYNGGTVCDDHFNYNSAAAICKNLGFSDASFWTSGQEWSVQESYNINMDDVRCSREDWKSCYHTESHNCGHSEDVFLTCTCTDGSKWCSAWASKGYCYLQYLEKNCRQSCNLCP